MLTFGIILAATSLLVVLAAFVDRFYADPVRDDKWRIALIGLYSKIEDSTPHLSNSEIGSVILTLLISIIFFAILLVISPIMYAVIGIYNVHYNGFFYWPDQFSSTRDFLHSLQIAGMSIFILLIGSFFTILSAYAISRLVFVSILGAATNPKYSPLAFTVAIIGIASSLGNLGISIARALLT